MVSDLPRSARATKPVIARTAMTRRETNRLDIAPSSGVPDGSTRQFTGVGPSGRGVGAIPVRLMWETLPVGQGGGFALGVELAVVLVRTQRVLRLLRGRR